MIIHAPFSPSEKDITNDRREQDICTLKENISEHTLLILKKRCLSYFQEQVVKCWFPQHQASIALICLASGMPPQ
jgi:hypothetical protein